MSRWNLAGLIGVPTIVLVGLLVAHGSPAREKEPDYELVRTLVEVLAEVDKQYVRELSTEQKRKLVEDMINGGLERLDPYSAYFNESEYRQFERNTEGNFGGIGIQLGVDRSTGMLTVISPMVGTPAYEGGILAGDTIVKIDGKSTENMRLQDAVEIIQGEIGQPVTLTVVHEGGKEPVDVPLVRARIEVPTVLGLNRKAHDPKTWNYWLDPERKIGYLRLVQFNEHSLADLAAAIEQLEQEGMTGLVLDLRDNPGGLLSAAVGVANLFLREGAIVSIRDRSGDGPTYTASGRGTLLEPPSRHPIAVLVNKYSASASEIVAAALQDHKRAVIVGERSFGKGSVQNVVRIPSDNPKAAIKLTTASYWRPSGQNIHRHPDSKDTDEWGVRPDPKFEVALSDEERLAYLLDRRQRDIIAGKPGAPKPKPVERGEGKNDKPFEDLALQKALKHLQAQVDGDDEKPPVVEPLKKAG